MSTSHRNSADQDPFLYVIGIVPNEFRDILPSTPRRHLAIRRVEWPSSFPDAATQGGATSVRQFRCASWTDSDRPNPTRLIVASVPDAGQAAAVRRTLSQLVQISERVRWWMGLPGVAAR